MVFLPPALASLPFATDAVARPAVPDLDPVMRGIQVQACRYILSSNIVSRDTGAVYHIWNGGGWIPPALTGTLADGSGASGPVYSDTVNIGGAIVPGFALGVCDDLRYGEGRDGTRDTAGPVGLGFGKLSSIRPNPQCTFKECLEPYVPEPIFGTAFKLNDTGFINFCYVDSEAYTGPFTEVPVINTSSWNEGKWMSLGVSFGSGGDLFDANPLDMDFDSGTASLSVSSDIAAAYWALVEGSDDSSGSWEYPGVSAWYRAARPSTFFLSNVSHGPSTVTIPSQNLRNGDGTTGMCSTWMNIVEGRGNAGVPFYISKYIVWNQAKPSKSADQVNR
ncbi:hypothetical protein BDW75DRAFT_229277 [Aspergillus navahoensis]